MKDSVFSSADGLAGFMTAMRPVELYAFSCEGLLKDKAVAPVVEDSFLGPLQATNPDLFSCDCSGHGIIPTTESSLPLLQSERNVSLLLEHIMNKEDPGLSLELWFTPSPATDSIVMDHADDSEGTCHHIKEKDVCTDFAHDSYLHGPIACEWYEPPKNETSSDKQPYCGYPGNRFGIVGDKFDAWRKPILKCKESAQSKEACEKHHLFEALPCHWEKGACLSRQPQAMAPLYSRLPLASFAAGEQTVQNRTKGCPGTGHDFDLKLTQRGRAFTVSHSGSDKWTCSYSYNPLKMMIPRKSQPTHIVVTMSDVMRMGTAVFLDGKPADKKPIGHKGSGGFQDWNPSMFFQLFSDYDTMHMKTRDSKFMSSFRGAIHMVAIYDRRLSADEVSSAHQVARKNL